MKCLYHPGVDAVAVCSDNCGTALCRECAALFNPPTCHKCFKLYCVSARSKADGVRTKAMVAIGWNATFFVLGIIMAAIGHANNQNSQVWQTLCFFWGVSGMPWILSQGFLARDNSVEAQARRIVAERVDPFGSVFEGIVGFLFKIFLGFIIGAIASPFLLISSIVKFKESTQRIKDLDSKLSRLRVQ